MVFKQTARQYLGLVFQPLPKAWGFVTVGVPAAVAAVLWSLEYGLWAAGIFLVSLVVFLAIAGYRLQRRLDAMEATRGLRGELGQLMEDGRSVLATILVAAGLDLVQQEANAWPGSDREAVVWAEKAKSEIQDWEESVETCVGPKLGSEYVARFNSRAALPRMDPPAEWFAPGWTAVWQQVQHGRMRLEEFIKEVPREPPR